MAGIPDWAVIVWGIAVLVPLYTISTMAARLNRQLETIIRMRQKER